LDRGDRRKLNAGTGVVLLSLAIVAGAPEVWFIAVPLLIGGTVAIALTCGK
jgi:hypothetical protein